MILEVFQDNLHQIKNPELRKYAGIYVSIYQDFMHQITRSGVQVAAEDHSEAVRARLDALMERGALIRNDRKSVVVNTISPACEACQLGIGSATYFISLQCHRDCFYCFNPNQENYQHYQTHERDVVRELKELRAAGGKVQHLALTGGEPLLHKEKTIDFFTYARDNFPDVYTRLYTCGDQIDEPTLKALQEAGLQEIRFSIRMHDSEQGLQHIYDRISLAREYIPHVMVEMPVLPETLEEMKVMLRELDRRGLYSINLLELCFPLQNADVFNQRGYQVKKRPYRVLYNYWYAGGIPVAGSEEVCLDLVEFSLDEGLKLGVHYCSVENKQTGQVYQQNTDQTLPETAYFSPRDFFVKTAKVFGEDKELVKDFFDQIDYHTYEEDPEHGFLEFHVAQIPYLVSLRIEIGISSQVFETRNGETYLRELKVDVTTPQQFRLEML